MAKQYWATIYIDRNPNNLDEGWGWVELTVEDVRRFGLSTKTPQPRQVTKQQEGCASSLFAGFIVNHGSAIQQ